MNWWLEKGVRSKIASKEVDEVLGCKQGSRGQVLMVFMFGIRFLFFGNTNQLELAYTKNTLKGFGVSHRTEGQGCILQLGKGLKLGTESIQEPTCVILHFFISAWLLFLPSCRMVSSVARST